MIAPEIPAPRIAACARSLTKIYGQGDTQVVALDHVDVDFMGGRFTAVMGPSGSGKSTLMHCVAGLDRPTSGDVFIGETTISTLRDSKLTALRRDRIGFIFQAFNLVPTLTARENIELPMAIAGRKPDRDWFDQVITAVGLADRLTHKPAQLSGGQQQRVACARALVSKPDIIFADEPTGNLDSRSSAEVLAFLARSVVDLGQTIVMVTHDPVAAAHADHALFLADGRIVGDLPNPTRENVLDCMARLNPDDELADADTTEIPAITNPIKIPIPAAAPATGPATGRGGPAATTGRAEPGRRAPASGDAVPRRTGDAGTGTNRPAAGPGAAGRGAGVRAPAAQGPAGRAVPGAPAVRPVEHLRAAPPASSRPPTAPIKAPAAATPRPAVRPPNAAPVAPSNPVARMPAPVSPVTGRPTFPRPAARPVPHSVKPSPTRPTSPDIAHPTVRREPVVPRSAPAAPRSAPVVPTSASAPPRPASVGTAPNRSASTAGPAGFASWTEHTSVTNGTARNGSGPRGAGLNGAAVNGERRINGAGPIGGGGPTRGGTNVGGTNGTTVPAAGRPRFLNPFAPMTGPAAPSTGRASAVPPNRAVTPPVNNPAPPGRPGGAPPYRSESGRRTGPENGPVDGNRRPDGIGASGAARSNPFTPGTGAVTAAPTHPGPFTPSPAAPRPFTAGHGAGGPLTRHAASGATAAGGPGANNRSAAGTPGLGGRAAGSPTAAGSVGAGGSSSAAPAVNGRSRTGASTRAPGGSGAVLRPIVPAPMPVAGAHITIDGHREGTPFTGTTASAPAAAARGSVDGSAHRQEAPAPGRAAPLRRADPVVPPPFQAAPPVIPAFPPHVPPAVPLTSPFTTPAAHPSAQSASSSRRVEPFSPAGVPGAPPVPSTPGRTDQPSASSVPSMWAEPGEPTPDRARAIPAREPLPSAVDGTDTGTEQVYDAPAQLPRMRPARSMSDERPARYRPARRA